ncbi:MAG: homocysteine S-methyltransferase family protein [Gaiellaceae bacterium]
MQTRHRLPELGGDPFLTDGGLETTLIFRNGLELPDFASFVLLDDPNGLEALREYYESYVEIARRRGIGIIIDTVTWRANPDWGAGLGYSTDQLADLNRRAVALLDDARGQNADDPPILISGCIGPRGDGYKVGVAMTPDEAEHYHSPQIEVFADTTADLVTAWTLSYPEEAMGIARAAQKAEIPVVISFTVETDGRLPNGQSLREAIEAVDEETGAAAAYFMVNCAHPTHFEGELEPGPWLERLWGIRANPSVKSHAELDEATELDAGDPVELAADYARLRAQFPQLNVLGGCCGTDERHLDEIAAVLT